MCTHETVWVVSVLHCIDSIDLVIIDFKYTITDYVSHLNWETYRDCIETRKNICFLSNFNLVNQNRIGRRRAQKRLSFI